MTSNMAHETFIPDAGNIIWLDLNPHTGHEQSGRRPCLVLSSRLYAERTGMAVVCPITSKIKGLPFEIELKGTATTLEIKKYFYAQVREINFSIYSVSLDKPRLHEHLTKNKEQLYNFIAGLVINKIPFEKFNESSIELIVDRSKSQPEIIDFNHYYFKHSNLLFINL